MYHPPLSRAPPSKNTGGMLQAAQNASEHSGNSISPSVFTGWQLCTERLRNQWAVDITKVICESPSSRSVFRSPLRKCIEEKNPHRPARPRTFSQLHGSRDKEKREGACRHGAGDPATRLKSLTARLDLEASPESCYLSGTPFTHTMGKKQYLNTMLSVNVANPFVSGCFSWSEGEYYE